MIHLSYYRLINRLSPATFNELLQILPASIQQKILKFRNWQDAERSLAGNILLIRALDKMGLERYTLDQLKYTGFQKPYFDAQISFNISHSGDYILCAVSETEQVGVDVEEITNIPIDEFAHLFAPVEWSEVTNHTDRHQAFFTLWTKKEAFLKVIGCGLNQPLNEVIIQHNHLNWDGQDWFLEEITLDRKHIAYICSDNPAPLIEVTEMLL